MILNNNSTQQINTLVIQLQNRITNLTNESRKLNNNINDLDSEISDLEKRVSSNENDADNNIDGLDSKISDLERRVSSLANDASAMNTAILANTEAINGKADKSHTHTKSQITDFDHTHDDRYYTESEIDTKLSGKSDTGHTHTKSEITDFPTSLPANGGTADKAVEVVDYGDTSRAVRIGYHGPGVTADKLLYLAGYTEQEGNSVKLKDVNKEELIKWLGIPRIKYADYQTPEQTFTQFQQVPIELSKFSSEVTPNNVLCFMVIYWTGVQLIASADWGNDISSGLKCALIALRAGTGSATIRCVYMV